MRTARRLVAALALAAGVLALACACGGVVDRPGHDTAVGSETALVVWDGAAETILLRLSTRTDALTAGLIVPTPTAATVRLGDDQILTDLSRITAARRETRRHLFGPPLLFGGGGDDGSAGAAAGGVQVLATVDLGPLTATTLTAADTESLHRWLSSHHFVTTSAFTNSVAPYVSDGWSFVAVQLDAASGDLDGDLPAIELSFASDLAVYPMRMSAAAASTQQPLVYVLADHRMGRTDTTAQGATRPEVRFAGPVDPADTTAPTLRSWLTTTPYLTATTQWLPDPTQIVSDFTFGRAPDDTAYHDVYYDDSYLLPGDIGALLILLLLGGGVWLVLRARRRRRFPVDRKI